MWTPPTSRYPDPAVQVLDDSFLKLRLRTASVERLATGFRWAEGPVWFGDQRCLIWSDIPNNQMLRWDEQSGAVSIFRKIWMRASRDCSNVALMMSVVIPSIFRSS